MFLLIFSICLLVLSSDAIVVKEKPKSHEDIVKALCESHTNSTAELTWCVNLGSVYNPSSRSAKIDRHYEETMSRKKKFLETLEILDSRVSSQNLTISFIRDQTFDNLEIRNGSLIISGASNNSGPDLNGIIRLDSAVAISTGWINFEILDKKIGDIQSDKLRLQSFDEITKHQVVWLNESVNINGSCCLLANVSFHTEHQLVTNELEIVRDCNDSFLDGDLTWGIVLHNEKDFDYTLLTNLTFTDLLTVNILGSSSLDLSNAVTTDNSNLTITGVTVFDQLNLEEVEIDRDDEYRESLASIVPIVPNPDTETVDLLKLYFEHVQFDSLQVPLIDKLNLYDLLTINTDQASTSTKTFHIDKLQLDGSSITMNDTFAVKLVNYLMDFMKADSDVHYDELTLNSDVHVTNMSTNIWDEYTFMVSNETHHFTEARIQGSTVLFYVNQLKYDEDFVRLESNEMIYSPLDFEDLSLPVDKVRRFFNSGIPVTNWNVDGDLEISGHLNDRDWTKLTDDLVTLDNEIDSLTFAAPVDADNCNFGVIDEVETSNLMKISDIGNNESTSSLRYVNIHIVNLVLDQVNVSSCCNRDIVSDQISPIEHLSIEELQIDGDINDISPSWLILNGTNQIFTESFDISSSVSMAILNLTPKKILSSNFDTPELNGIRLDRITRAYANTEWPETLIIESCNLTKLDNRFYRESLSNLLLKDTDQQIDGDLTFESQVNFTGEFNILNTNNPFWFDFPLDENSNLAWYRLDIVGNLSARKLYVLDQMKNITTNQNVSFMNLTVNGSINTKNGLIANHSEWKVHHKATLTSVPNLTIDNLIVEKNLTISRESGIPWFDPDSLNGIEYYHEVILANLSSLDFHGNLNYSQLESNSKIIKLEEILDVTSDELQNLQFTQSTKININVSSDTNIALNLMELKDDQHDSS